MASRFELRKSSGGKYFFNLKASNNRVILTSEEYSRRAAALGGIDSVRASAEMPDRYEPRTANDGSPYFVLVGGNRRVIGQSHMYTSASSMATGMASVKLHAQSAVVLDFSD